MSFTSYFDKAVRYFRPFNWINVEVTSKCNLKCTMCPRRAFESPDKNMDRDLFVKLSRDFNLFKMVDLTGWGEPLMHPSFFEFVRIAKSKRCLVKYVSNGVAFNQSVAEETLKTGVDWIVFSVDSPDKTTYREIRGADLDKVASNIGYLSELKKKNGLKYPLIDIAIVISRKNIAQLPEMVKYSKEIGASRLVVNNVHVISKKEDIDILLFKIDQSQRIDEQQRDTAVAESKKTAAEVDLDLSFCFSSFEPKKLDRCVLDIEKTMFIDSEGNISACCDLGHPVPGYLDCNTVVKNTQLNFGNVRNQSIMEIYNSKAYADFRKRIKSGVPDECRHCMLLKGI
ncbi:MAG: hypothetical protein A2297_01100 [Elusimicrobia bacterium RIFOXYB2_FULL_48_7]|nr:MAG: hypothetical protein A2297_01100 [Elusimicrobia bacterium RIFOXYB2_FULL_48_7]